MKNVNDECGMFHLRRTSRAVSTLYADILDHADLDSSYFSILITVSRFGPLSISDIANRVGLERTTVSRNLNALVEKQLVKVSDKSAARSRFVEITAAGNNAIEQAKPKWRKAQQDFRSVLGDEDTNTLIEILDRAYKATQSL